MILFLLTLLISCRAYAQPHWTPQIADSNWEETKSLNKYLFPSKGFPQHRGPRTDAALIITDNKIIYESYSRGHNPEKKHIGWSVSKTFLNAITGVYVQKNWIKLEDSVCKYIKPENKDHCKIKIHHLLNWTSGLDWRETYEKTENPKTSSVMAMLYGVGRNDIGKFLTSHKLIYQPGTKWRYSSGDSNYLSYVLMHVKDKSNFRKIIDKEFFEKINIDSYVLEAGKQGVPLFSSHLYLSARNLAKLGELYLQNGKLNNKQILPENWVFWSTNICPEFYKSPKNQNKGYTPGAHIWVNKTNDKVIHGPAWQDIPTDTIAAQGHWGQMLFIIPSLKTIIVRFGDHREKVDFNTNTFLKLAIALVNKGEDL